MANNVTEILKAIDTGDQQAADQLLPLVYDELRRLAKAKLSNERPDQSLQATALVHEAYLRLVGDGDEVQWNSRGHFFGAAAEAMRRILVDRARARGAQKRGGDFKRVDLDAIDHPAAGRPDRLLAMDQALERLAEEDSVKADLVKLRFFAGLTNKQAAAALNISDSTADRYWAYARAWLQVEMAK